MKRVVILFLFVFVGVLSAQKSGPKISTSADTFDFGTIKEGSKVNHDFEIINAGDAVLKIDKVRASCGCTAAKPEKDSLAPGESAKIHVEFNSAGRSGIQQKYVYVFSNDPNDPQFRFQFTTNVVASSSPEASTLKAPRMILNENQHDFGTVKEGQVLDLKVAFKNTGDGELKIGDVKTSCGCTAAVVSNKNISPGGAGELRIELDTANREGKITRTVTVNSNDPVQPAQTITLFVNIDKRN